MKITISIDDGEVIEILNDVQDYLTSSIGESLLYNDIKECIERGLRIQENNKGVE